MKLVQQLGETLKSEGINYCHWKSNNAIARSMAGDNDLDLLVSRAENQRFTRILYQLGFKEARRQSHEQLPGVLHYFGYEAGTEKFIHVHVHYQLIVGHDRTKNYHLPIEEAFLASASEEGVLKIPAPAFEYIVFIIRMVLKHSTWDAIVGGQGALSLAAEQEFQFLRTQVSQESITDILARCLPYIEESLFTACVESLQPLCPRRRRMKTGIRLQRRLRAHARRPQSVDLYLKAERRVKRGIVRRMPRGLRKQRLSSGGMLIGFVGGDGAGKSTAASGLNQWLCKNFDTMQVHLGKPPWSISSYLIRGAVKLASIFSISRVAGHRQNNCTDIKYLTFADYVQLFKHVCVARDRLKAYTKARRFATNGGIVICDRFPLPGVMTTDAPKGDCLIKDKVRNRFSNFLISVETNCYSLLNHPDLLVVLLVDPEVAVERKVDEETETVKARNKEVWTADWKSTRGYIINAARRPDEVLSELKSLVWSHI